MKTILRVLLSMEDCYVLQPYIFIYIYILENVKTV